MNSKVINYVAGGGKTTYSRKLMQDRENGLYLAFTNSVVNEMKFSGVLSLTISSLFASYILPKMFSYIPIIASGSSLEYNGDSSREHKRLSAIKIDERGDMWNQSKKIEEVNLCTENIRLHDTSTSFKNRDSIRRIFSKSSVLVNDAQRDKLSHYLVNNYPDMIVKLLQDRFDFIIIDEAQDIKSGFMEDFVKLLHGSCIELILIGDPYQNVNNGSRWFGNLKLTERRQNVSYRCPDANCKWIRDKLKIDICGNNSYGGYYNIDKEDVLEYDDGNRHLLYVSMSKKDTVISQWKGKKTTIKSAKGSTIQDDIVIYGKTLNKKNMYTAITRTTKKVFSTIEKINN